MEQAIMCVMAAGAIVGGIDRIFGNKLGLGKKFEDGFYLMGSAALSMVGILCLAPLLALLIESAIAPLCGRLGFDPGSRTFHVTNRPLCLVCLCLSQRILQ